MNWQAIIDPAVCGRVCVMLLHSLWQIALLAVLARSFEWLRGRRSADASYAVYVTALLAAFAAMPITYMLVGNQRSLGPSVTAHGADSAAPNLQVPTETQPAAAVAQAVAHQGEPRSTPATGARIKLQPQASHVAAIHWDNVAPWVVGGYLAGVAAMIVRLASGVLSAHRMAARSLPINEGPLVDALRALCRNWSMRVVPALARAESIVVPKVVGFIRPTILLPASAITGLSAEELEMVLAHELAHVKRYDMWVNLAQRLAEAVLFFNPALWYLSRRISAVREFCCDELTCGSLAQSHPSPRTQYAMALLHVVELSRRLPESSNLAALAASGRSPSELRRRVARLFGEPLREPLRVSRGGVLTLTAIVAFMLLGPFTWKSAVQSAEEPPKREPVEVNVVVAKHVMLLEGKQIITWNDLEAIIAGMPHPELANPQFYETGGAREAGLTPVMKDHIWKLHERFKLVGHSEGSLWPRTDLRYDRIKQASDLEPDKSLAVVGTILDAEGKPVQNAEVVLVTPVDDSISFKEVHVTLVQGELRNPLEDVNTKSDKDGKFTLYPAKDEHYYILAMHPAFGFATMRSDTFAKEKDIKLLPWSGLIGEVGKEPGEKQDATLHTTIPAADGWPQIVIPQYWADLKDKRPTQVFGFTHVPPILETSISRSFAEGDGGAISIPGAKVGLLPDETRSLDLGPLTEKQREFLKELRRTSRELHEKNKAAAQNAKQQRKFELTVVGPDGKPVPNAEIRVRVEPRLTAEKVLQGEFVKVTDRSTIAVRADKDGRLTVELPPSPKFFEFYVEHAGYGPYWSRWSSEDHPDPIPPTHVAELEAGWTVGGLVVDTDGKPIEGVEANPSVVFKTRPGDTNELYLGDTFKTDSNGMWKYASVPASMKEVAVSFNHPGHMPTTKQLSQSLYKLPANGRPSEKIELQRGISIEGTVTDEAGQPIAGALVRTKFFNDLREAKTGDDGKYRLNACPPRMTRVVVSAKGRALELKTVRVESEMEPVDFALKPGGHLRVVALDEQGKPIPKTRIFFQRWRGHIDYFEFDHINDYADENGVWEWNEAPHDETQADICRPDGMQLVQRPLVAREEEYVFHPPKALVVSGKVIDAKTKQPIKNFRAIPGARWPNNPSIHWSQNERYETKNGKYKIRQNREYPAHFVRIEADGYRAAASRDIKSDEGNVTIDFALDRGENIAATVLLPDGNPAARAKVALGVGGSQIVVENGDIDDGSTFHAARLETDEAGKFNFPPQDTNFQLVVTHPTGYAYLKATPDSAPGTIQLLAWAQVKGTFRVGPKPAPNVTLELYSNAVDSYGENEPHIRADHNTTTGPDGTFSFERVFAGSGWLGRRMIFMVDDGATEVTSTKRVKFELAPGETKQINVGGDGTPVTGKLLPAKGVKEKVHWNFATVNTQIDLPPLNARPIPAALQNDPKLREAWLKEWQLTPEGMAWKGISDANARLRKSSPYLRASVDPDGTFRIDDVPPGNYVLSAGFDHQHPAGGQLRDYKFTVPDDGERKLDEPVDLGLLQLE